jgi:hypothetical protein
MAQNILDCTVHLSWLCLLSRFRWSSLSLNCCLYIPQFSYKRSPDVSSSGGLFRGHIFFRFATCPYNDLSDRLFCYDGIFAVVHFTALHNQGNALGNQGNKKPLRVNITLHLNQYIT